MGKPTKITEQHQALYDTAEARVELNPDGVGRVEDRILEALALMVPFDENKHRKKLAKDILDGLAKPGGTEPEGMVQLSLFGRNDTAPWEYDPNRLIRDGNGNIAKNGNATVAFKEADAQRADEHARDARKSANRKRAEADHFAKWAQTHAMAGRAVMELTWETCVRETGILRRKKT